MADHLPSQRLTTWKEIGQYIGRDSRTAKRYEVERQLPVRRMPNGKKSTVYALRHELDLWLTGGQGAPSDVRPDRALPKATPVEAQAPPVSSAPPPPIFAAPPARSPRWFQRPAAFAIGLGVLTLSGLGALGIALNAPLAPTGMATAQSAADPNVQRLYRSGEIAWERRTPDDLRRAVDDFTQAIVLDPHYAPAYVGLADSYNLMPQYGVMLAAEAFPRAKAAAERAVRLSPRSADAHRALAFVTFWWGHETSRAMQEFKTAIELDPNSAQTYHWYANALSETGQDSEALASIEKARALDPSSTPIRASEGMVLKNAGNFAESKRVLLQIEADHPDYISAYDYMSGVYAVEGDDVGFLQQKEKSALLRKNNDAVQVVHAAQRALATSGHMAMLQELARGDAALARAGKQSPYELALAEMRLGGRRQAIEALEQAATELDPNAVGLARNSAFASLHGEPAFERLLVRIHSSH